MVSLGEAGRGGVGCGCVGGWVGGWGGRAQCVAREPVEMWSDGAPEGLRPPPANPPTRPSATSTHTALAVCRLRSGRGSSKQGLQGRGWRATGAAVGSAEMWSDSAPCRANA